MVFWFMVGILATVSSVLLIIGTTAQAKRTKRIKSKNGGFFRKFFNETMNPKVEKDEPEPDNNQEKQTHYESYNPLDMDIDTAYQIMGIREDASNEEITQLWKKLMKLFHPDGKEYIDKKRAQEINVAYQYIKKYRDF